jgi:large subunit ribosomal protein L9
MKILLLQDVKKVGRKMEVKEVSEGYARNFLFARKLAVPADAGAMKIKAQAEARENELVSRYKEMAKKLAGEVLEFKVKTGQKREVFGSVTAKDIEATLLRKGYGGQNNLAIILEKPIRVLGEHKVEVSFGKGVGGQLTIRLLS